MFLGWGCLFLAAFGWMTCAFASEKKTAAQEFQPRISANPQPPSDGSKRQGADLRLDVKVVLVPVSVTDSLNRPVTSLSKTDFRVLEDGVQQEITSLTREDGPVSLGLLFDTSGSMKNRIEASVDALKEFFATCVPDDEFFVIQFADEAQLLGGFTPHPDEIYSRLGVVQPRGWTALLDAVALGVHQMRFARHRKVLLVLSDGNDNNSRFSESEIRNMVMEGDLRVYAIALNYKPHLLQELAEESGGKVLVAQNIGALPQVVQSLSAEIRSEYVLGYTSSNTPKDGKYHKVKVELVHPEGASRLYASWRRGYYAPEE